jgi:hypothetical protein
MVAFQHKSVTVTQDRFDMGSRATCISQYAQSQQTVSKHELRRFLCIMGDRVRFYPNVPDGKTLVTLYDIDSWQFPERFPRTAQRAMCQPDRDAELACKPGNTANMIAMLMGYDNRIYRVRFETKPGEANNGFPERKTTIQQQPGVPCFDYQSVALRTTSQTGKAHAHEQEKL